MKKLSLLAAVLGSFLFACAEVPAEEAEGASTSAQKTAAPSPKLGEYVFWGDDNNDTSSVIDVTSIDNQLHFTVSGAGQTNIRQIMVASASSTEDGSWVFHESRGGCSIGFEFTTDGVDVEQHGVCREFGGTSIDVTGHHLWKMPSVKVKPATYQIVVGPAVTKTIEITKVASKEISVTVTGFTTAGHPEKETHTAYEKGDGNWIYNGMDWEVTLDFASDLSSVDVSEWGGGAYGDSLAVKGHYRKK